MSDELVALAQAGAAALVTAAVTQSWQATRDGFAALFRRAEWIERRLDATAVTLADDPTEHDRQVDAWRIRLLDLIADADDPATVRAELAALVQASGPAGGAGHTVIVNASGSGTTFGAVNMTIHGPVGR